MRKQCFFCKKDIDVLHERKEICVDGSTWFETMQWPVCGDDYKIVEGYNCLPVIVCDKCTDKIEIGELRNPMHPFASVRILDEPQRP